MDGERYVTLSLLVAMWGDCAMDDCGTPNSATSDAGRFSRRSVLKGALAAGVWVAPTVVVLRADPALAGSPPPTSGMGQRPETADLPADGRAAKGLAKRR